MRKTFLLALLLLIPALVCAKTGHLVLLTVVQQTGQPLTGGTADLYLEVRSGNGRIFIDSFPLTKLDTQISTRFANQIACSYLEIDCSVYDFFYKIEASSPIVGGPSAGAAITVLTVSVLTNLPLYNDTVITGTIDAGGLIGPVSGIYEKALAAQQAGFSKVLVPKWTPSLWISSGNTTNQSSNETKDPLANLSIEVIKIGTLDEAVYAYTGHYFNNKSTTVEIMPDYARVMQLVAEELCNRTQALTALIENRKLNYTDEENYTRRAEQTFNSSKYYATASLCFSNNIRLRSRLLESYTQEQLTKKFSALIKAASQLTDEIDNRSFETLTDLETYMIVKERLLETLDALEQLNLTNLSTSQLSYAIERYNSAKVWSQFFDLPGKKILLDKAHLKESCQKKISEAEERLSYVDLYAPGFLSKSRQQLGQAYVQLGVQSYAFCLFTASKVKAEADMFITASGVAQSQARALAEEQLLAARKIIAKEQAKGIFPILGYSYLEYAESLLEYNPINAITFAQYALEMSNLDMYFPQPRETTYFLAPEYYVLFIGGLITGVLVTFLIQNIKPKKTPKSLPGKKR